MSLLEANSLNDLRTQFYGGGSQGEYEFLQDAYAQGISAADLLQGGASGLTNKGELLTSDGSATFVLNAGADGQVLYADATRTGGIKWAAPPAAGVPSFTFLDAKGDLIVASADDTVTRLAVGADGYVLFADSASGTGLRWGALANFINGDLVNAKGDLLVASADNTVGRLGLGTDAYVLVADSTQTLGVKWAALPASVLQTLADAKGDIVVATGNDAFARLAVGADGQVLIADSGQVPGVRWGSISTGAILASLVDAKGDIIVGTNNDTVARLPVGTDGYVLTAASGQTSGLQWTAVSGAGSILATLVNAKGDLIVATADDTVTRLASGGNGQVLSADSTQATGLKWIDPPVTGLQATLADVKGDILAATGADAFARFAAGADGLALLADASATSGLRWGSVPSASVAVEDLYVGGNLVVNADDLTTILEGIEQGFIAHALDTSDVHGLTASKVPQANTDNAYVLKDFGAPPDPAHLPASGEIWLYAEADGLFARNHAGIETQILPGLVSQYARLTTTQSKTNNTYVNLFTAPTEESSVYRFQMYVWYDGGDNLGEVKLKFVMPGTGTLKWGALRISPNAVGTGAGIASAYFISGTDADDCVLSTIGAGTTLFAAIFGTFDAGTADTDAGTFTVKWAQSATNATASRLFGPTDFYINRLI